MVVMSCGATVFADIVDDLKKEPNAMALITIDNENCTEIPALGELSVRITAPNTKIDIVIPVEKVEPEGELLGLWLGYPEDRISDAIMNELAEIQGKVDLGIYEEEPEKFLTEIDTLLSKFQIEVIGLPDNHYSVTSGAMVLTNDIFGQIVEMFKTMIKEEAGDFESFSALIDALLKEEGLTVDQLLAQMGPEEAAALKDLIENIDPLLAYITSTEYSGLLIAGAELACHCPAIDYFQIIHKYYERVNGKLKLLGTVCDGTYDADYQDYYIKGYVGDTIKGKDFANCWYDGRLFEYVGSYDAYALYDDYKWSDYKLDSFTVGDWQTDGLVLRYVVEGETETALDKAIAPDTGDRTSLGMYIVLLFTALGATGAVAGYHKKK